MKRPAWWEIVEAEGLSATEVRFLLLVLSKQGRKDSTWYRQSFYAGVLGVTDRQVRRLIANCQTRGWLSAEPRGRQLHLAVRYPSSDATARPEPGHPVSEANSGRSCPVSEPESGHQCPVSSEKNGRQCPVSESTPDISIRSDRTSVSGDVIGRIDTGSSSRKRKPQKKSGQPASAEAKRLAELLLGCIRKRKRDFKRPNLDVWAGDIDKMIRLDNRRPEGIEGVIKYATADTVPRGRSGFCWALNILSTRKLRDHFDRLEMNMEAKGYGNGQIQNREGRGFGEQRSTVGEELVVW